MQTLRDYQSECVDAVMQAVADGKRRILYTLATGGGKTVIMGEIIKRILADDPNARVLCIVHRQEIVSQIHKRVAAHCNLDPYYEVGIEQNTSYAPSSCKIVVGNVATVRSEKRLQWFEATHIITDECHRAAARSYKMVYDRFGVPGKCVHIGCTATAKRTDKLALCAHYYCCGESGCRGECGVRDTPTRLMNKKGEEFIAQAEDCVFDYHVYQRDILTCIEDGFLVPVVGYTIQTKTDISHIANGIDGDFAEGQLQEAVNNDERNRLIVSGWFEKGCINRPTIMFSAGVDHAFELAKEFQKAGINAKALCGDVKRAQTLDPTYNEFTRDFAWNEFKAGRIPVICNDALFVEGADAPVCSCIGMAKPGKSWNNYVQKVGRGLRPLEGIVEHCEDALARQAAIEWSSKPDCVVLDFVDICGKHDLCALPSILDLPAKLDLQGKSLTAAKKMLDDYQDASDHMEDDGKELPMTFQKLQVKLQQIELIRGAKDKASGWKVTDDGFRYTNLAPGYESQLLPADEGQYTLRVEYKGKEIFSKTGKPLEKFRNYLHYAAKNAVRVTQEHSAAIPKGTLEALSPKQIRVLKRRGHTEEEIDAMPHYQAKDLISQYVAEYRESVGAI